MTSDELSDWLQPDGEYAGEKRATWDDLLKLDLTGCKVDFGCHGGDMLRLTGYITLIFMEGGKVKMKLRDVEISPEDPDEKEQKGVLEKRDEEVVELSTYFPPIIRETLIVLDAGLDDLPGYDLGSGFNSGFIFKNETSRA